MRQAMRLIATILTVVTMAAGLAACGHPTGPAATGANSSAPDANGQAEGGAVGGGTSGSTAK